MRYREILEACWKGYRQDGMKKKGDRMVPNCVPVSEQEMEEDLRKWFKEKWVRFGPDGKIRGDCARGSEKEGKPKCLPQAKAHALGKKGRASAAAKKRREDPNPERRGPARNVATKVKEALGLYGPFTVTINTGERPQSRTKTKKFKREDDAILWAEDWLEDFPQYSFATAQVTDPDGNVVWATDESLEEQNDWDDADEFGMPGSEFFPEKQLQGHYKVYYMTATDHKLMGKYATQDEAEQRVRELKAEYPDNQFIVFASQRGMKEQQELDKKQDACYHKVKSRYKVWPSAYASGALVQCRKKGAANWGNKGKKK